MATPSAHNLIQLFTHEEYTDFYGLPIFSDEERAHFFILSLHDSQLINSFKTLQDKIYCLLSLGYFRAKKNIIDFKFSSITADRRYIMNVYFSKHKTPRKLPSKSQQIRIQNKVLLHEKYFRHNQKFQEIMASTLKQLVKRHPKARPLTKAFLHFLNEQKN